MSSDVIESGKKPATPVAGPSLPPHLLDRSSALTPSIGPSIPPHLLQRSDNDEEEKPTPRRVLGPTMPPRANDEEVKLSTGAHAFLDREKRMKEAAVREAAGLPPKSKESNTSRPDWMMAPPTAQSFSETLQKDQSAALKNRGFSQAQNARVQRGKGGGLGGTNEDDSSLWTETPQEREQRLREEELGIRAKVVNGTHRETDEERERRVADLEREERLQAAIREHEAQRGPSLLEQHQSKRREELKGKKSSGRDKERDVRDDVGRSRRRKSYSNSDESGDDNRKHRRRYRESEDRHRHSRHRRNVESESDSYSSDDDRRRREKRKSGSRYSEKERGERDRHQHRSHRDRSKDRDRDERRKEKERERERKQKRRDREKEEKEEKKGGAPTMIWDRDAALSVGGKLLDDQKRRETIRSAAGLGSRFGSGSARYL